MQLVTRAALGWPPSAAPDQPTTLGVKVHYEGTPVSTNLLADHAACLREWQNIRASHLANTAEGYVDVAYNYAACPHGYLLEGRGVGKRTGANGNQDLNRGHYAIVGLVGSEGLTSPTDAMLNAIRDGIELLQHNGAGPEIRGHRDGYATDCPGPALYAWVQAGAPRPNTTPTVQEDDMPTAQEVAVAVALEPVLRMYTSEGRPRTDATASLSDYLGGLRISADQMAVQLAALGAAINTLATQLGQAHGVDTATVVAAVQKAIADAVVNVHVDVTSPTPKGN